MGFEGTDEKSAKRLLPSFNKRTNSLEKLFKRNFGVPKGIDRTLAVVLMDSKVRQY